MRNLREYPITFEEMVQAIEKALGEYEWKMRNIPPERRPIGDIYPMALRDAAEYMKSHIISEREGLTGG